jgi:N-methylhydantoinase B
MDLMTVEVLQRLLLAVAEEMGITLVRTAYSPNIKERRDCSTAVFDAAGRVIAQAAHIPMHLSSMVDLPRLLLEAYPRRSLRPGDVFVANDPYTGAGSHLNDIAVIAPVFWEGASTAPSHALPQNGLRGRSPRSNRGQDRALVGFVASTAHHADVGGRVPGSESGDSTSIFQDGLRLPVVRLVTRGRLEDGIRRTILLNSRTPGERAGDLRAQLAACRAGARRLQEICRERGRLALEEAVEGILDATERRTRDGIGRLPDGVYEAEGFCDDDGLEARPVRIRVVVRIEGDRIHLDFAGTEPQVPGAKNVPAVSLLATVYYVLKAVIDPDIPPDAGYYRAITVEAPPGCVLNPRPPAAVAARFTTCQKVADVLLTALARAVPDRVIAHCHGGTLAIYAGTRPGSGEVFVDYEVYAGGSGARAGKDGMDGIANHTTNTSNLPIEALETEFPILVERYELVPDSGGPGRFRGGLAVVREVRGLAGDLTVGGWGCDQREPPAGLDGGGAGLPGVFEVVAPDGRIVETRRSTVSGLALPAGHRLRVRTSGGGGRGDPLDRDPADVARDLAAGKVTAAHARDAHAIMIDGAGIDLEGTLRLRAERRAARGEGAPIPGSEPGAGTRGPGPAGSRPAGEPGGVAGEPASA